MHHSTKRPGYTFLLSVLFVGAIAMTVAGSIFLNGWLALRNSETFEGSAQSFEYAVTCAERALRDLFEDVDYAGDETVNFSNGSCYILPISGSGNNNRTVCTEGVFGDNTRRVEIIIEQVLPEITIFAWQEVEFFTSCSY